MNNFRKSSLALLAFAIVVGVCSLAFTESYGVEAPTGRKVDASICVKEDGTNNPPLTGFSNDCAVGEGSCIDNKCPRGTTEKNDVQS